MHYPVTGKSIHLCICLSGNIFLNNIYFVIHKYFVIGYLHKNSYISAFSFADCDESPTAIIGKKLANCMRACCDAIFISSSNTRSLITADENEAQWSGVGLKLANL